MDVQKIEECIKFLNESYVSEIIAGDYKITSICQYDVKLITNSGKRFCLWISNTHDSFGCYESQYNFMDLAFSIDEKKELHARFRAVHEDKRKNPEEVEIRRKQFEKLKAEFEPQQS